jgi:Sec-independent protein secretion pathway component TatC
MYRPATRSLLAVVLLIAAIVAIILTGLSTATYLIPLVALIGYGIYAYRARRPRDERP